jgi:hypothetical protein
LGFLDYDVYVAVIHGRLAPKGLANRSSTMLDSTEGVIH